MSAPESVSGPRIAAVLRVIADYYDGCHEDLTDEEVGRRRSEVYERLVHLGEESLGFAKSIYVDSIRYAPEFWPDIPSQKVSEWDDGREMIWPVLGPSS